LFLKVIYQMMKVCMRSKVVLWVDLSNYRHLETRYNEIIFFLVFFGKILKHAILL
jgi:hypothetical protein